MSAWSRFWHKWNSCRSCIRTRAVLGTILQLLGSMLISFAIMYAVQTAAASAASAAVYRAGACAGCPAGASLETVQVQDRDGSVLFAVGGSLPSTPAGLPADVRIEANDLDVILRPDAAGFLVVSATKGGAALPPNALAAGITDGHLVVDLRDEAIAAPVQFAIGLWKDGAYQGRIPATGRLEWVGQGAPRALAAAAPTPSGAVATATATAAPTVATAPAATAASIDVMAPAGRCTSFTAELPPFPRPQTVTSGQGPDPRTNVSTPFISTTFAGPVPTEASSRAPFSVTVVLSRAGQGTSDGTRAIDRTGSMQLWAYWDGTTMHKAIRTWTGTSWQVRTNTAADELTVALRAQSLAVYWNGLRAGDQYGSIVAAAGGCRSIGTDDRGRPQQRIP